MSVVRIGATKKYSDNWDKIFSGGRSAASKATTKPAKKSPKKAAKTAGKKKAGAKKRKGK